MLKIKNKPKSILFLGPEGSFTEMAKDKALNILGLNECESVTGYNIQEIIAQVDNNKDIIGVIPVENSIEGLVRETVDKIIRTTNYVRVFQEVVLPISHCLINKSGDISQVKNVMSIPQALGQCSDYIYQLSKRIHQNINQISKHSTSFAVKSLMELDDSYAAIASQKAANVYGMKIVEKDINDEPDNKTRFICIGHEYPPRTGNDRTSIAFTIQNQSGTLVDVLMIFKQNNINMSYIDSRPSKKNLGEYTFFVDLDGHVEDDKLRHALSEIKPLISFYRLIGSYPKHSF